MSCVKGVTGIEILVRNHCICPNNKYKQHNFAQLLIGHNYAHLKSGAFSLDMSLFYCTNTI